MGAQNSVEATHAYLEKRAYKVVQEVEHALFGSFKVYEDEQGAQIGLINQIFQNQNEFTQFYKKCKKIQEKPFQAGIQVMKIFTDQDAQLCSQTYKVTLVAQNDLTQGVGDRRADPVPDSDEQPAEPAIRVGHGVRRPEPQQHLRRATPGGRQEAGLLQYRPGPAHLRDQQLQEDHQRGLGEAVLAARDDECLHVARLQVKHMKFNYQKCDVYALGLICLCKALQKDVQDLYDMENYVVDSQLLDKYLADYGHKFGVLLRNQLKHLLQEDPMLRPTFTELTTHLEVLQLQRTSELHQRLSHDNGFSPSPSDKKQSPIDYSKLRVQAASVKRVEKKEPEEPNPLPVAQFDGLKDSTNIVPKKVHQQKKKVLKNTHNNKVPQTRKLYK